VIKPKQKKKPGKANKNGRWAVLMSEREGKKLAPNGQMGK
jgi:hypothetical protein